MTITAATTTKPPSDFLAAAALPARTKRNRKILRAMLRDIEKSNHPRSTEDYIERVNARADKLLATRITSIVEADLLLQLVLASDGEGLDEPVKTALESVASVLAAAAEKAAKAP